MKKINNWILGAAILCSAPFITSCVADKHDNPAQPEAVKNREVLLSHIENAAQTMATETGFSSLNTSSQAVSQLMSLLQHDKNFIKNMKTVLQAVVNSGAKAVLKPVTTEYELFARGYLAYLSVDGTKLGFKIVFDGKGNGRLAVSDYTEIIFPATVDGIGTTFFKLTIKNDGNFYQAVSDANIPQMKRIGLVTHLPKKIIMTLSCLVDDKEVVISTNEIAQELYAGDDAQYVCLDEVNHFKIYGRSLSKNGSGDEGILDINVEVENAEVTFGYNFGANGKNFIASEMTVPQDVKTSFSSRIEKGTSDVKEIKDIKVTLLDDLMLTGDISGESDFMQVFSDWIMNRNTYAEDVVTAFARQLNSACHLQLSCPNTTKPETIRFCVVKSGDGYTIEPGLQDLNTGEYVPITTLVDAKTREIFMQAFSHSFTPAGSSVGSMLQLYSVFMQMMP